MRTVYKFIDGKKVKVVLSQKPVLDAKAMARRRRVFRELGIGTTQGFREDKPGRSTAMGCHSTQAKQFNERARSMGISGISWNEKGHCIITSRSARREYMKAIGLHDNDGGYSDG